MVGVRMEEHTPYQTPWMSGLLTIHRSQNLPKSVRMRTDIQKFQPKFVRTPHILMGGHSGVLAKCARENTHHLLTRSFRDHLRSLIVHNLLCDSPSGHTTTRPVGDTYRAREWARNLVVGVESLGGLRAVVRGVA